MNFDYSGFVGGLFYLMFGSLGAGPPPLFFFLFLSLSHTRQPFSLLLLLFFSFLHLWMQPVIFDCFDVILVIFGFSGTPFPNSYRSVRP